MAKPTPGDRARERSILTGWVALSLILLLTAGGFAIAYIHGTNAGRQTADCVNSILGTRGPVTDADSQAQREFIEEAAKLTHVLSVVITAPPALQAEKFALFVTEVREFNVVAARSRAVLNLDQAYRHAHPLGRC